MRYTISDIRSAVLNITDTEPISTLTKDIYLMDLELGELTVAEARLIHMILKEIGYHLMPCYDAAGTRQDLENYVRIYEASNWLLQLEYEVNPFAHCSSRTCKFIPQ